MHPQNMTFSTKHLLLVLGIVLGILLSFGVSEFETILKNKTDLEKNIFNFIARVASIVSVGIFILTILKKIRIRPTWSYFVMGISPTYSIMNIVILPLIL